MSPEFLKSVGDAVAEKMLGIRKAVGFLSDQIKGVQGRIDALEARAAVPGPKGSDGKDGKDGRDGKDAEPVDIQDVVRALIHSDEIKTVAMLAASEAVGDYFKANPVQHGKDGKDGAPGRDGERGEKGEKGEDGRGLTGFLVNRDGELVATTNKGETLNLGTIVGKDGKDYEGHSVEYDPATHEGVIKTLSGLTTRFPLPGIIGRGYWREGQRAKAGDAWTHDGTLWIAKCDTSTKPETGSEDWFIGARKGRDAK